MSDWEYHGMTNKNKEFRKKSVVFAGNPCMECGGL